MEKIIIIDFGSQLTQLVGRRLRELDVCCETHPFNRIPEIGGDVKGVILSGSPASVRGENAPRVDLDGIKGRLPLLGICYGAQYLSYHFGGMVEDCDSREYGRAVMTTKGESPLFEGIPESSQVWMSHGDTITRLPDGAELIGSTGDVVNAAYRFKGEHTYGVQFHPEVFHSEYGAEMLKNFAMKICGCSGCRTSESFAESFIKQQVEALRKQIGNDKVILGLSGGIDSTVTAVLLDRAIGPNLKCVFIDNGMLRKNEAEQVLESYAGMGLDITCMDCSKEFMKALEGISDPELKRKAAGRAFIEAFEAQARKIGGVKWLAQGTTYPDVIESCGPDGIGANVKSHHNTGGLPEKMTLRLVEPLRMLFKDEVREIARVLGISETVVGRHPFPGPALGIRIIGEVTKEKIDMLREADDIFVRRLRCRSCDLPSASDPRRRATDLYDSIWQAGAILLPVRSVGVMGDERTYEYTCVLRAVFSTDGMTADWMQLPHDFLAEASSEIINKVRGVNRVCYDITSKPPATIEWE